MPITLPNLPNLAGTNVTPNVPTHVLADTDITVVNSSATLGIGADRKVTLGELKASIVTPITDPIADTVSAITSKAVLVDMKDADSTTGVLNFNAAVYGGDVHLLVVNTTSVAPPASPGYFTLTIGSALPAGCTLHITGAFAGSSWTAGTVLPVKVHFTNSYSQGLGELLYPYPDWVSLVKGGHFSAIVMYDGQTWNIDATDLLALAAFRGVYARSALVLSGGSPAPTGYIGSSVTNYSGAHVSLTSGNWIISATALVTNNNNSWPRVTLELSPIETAPSFADGACAVFSVPPKPDTESAHSYSTVSIPSKRVPGGDYSIWGTSVGDTTLRGWSITAIPVA